MQKQSDTRCNRAAGRQLGGLLVLSRSQTPWYRWLKWGDYLVYLLIILAAVILFLQGPALLKPIVGGEGLVSVDNEIVRQVSASEMGGTGSFTMESYGYHYTVEYDKGRIRISQADCPDQVCVQTGWVSRFGEVSACVPGHVILSVSQPAGTSATSPSGDAGQDVDVVLK